jgi:hypothetical protein
MKPISYYYSSRSHPLPLETEAYLERLPVAQKILIATALLNQCAIAFQPAPTPSVFRPILTDEDTAS